MIPKYDAFCGFIVSNLTNLGVENKRRQVKKEVKKKIAEIEVTKDSIKQMDIGQLLENMQLYEQALLEQDPECGGPGF